MLEYYRLVRCSKGYGAPRWARDVILTREHLGATGAAYLRTAIITSCGINSVLATQNASPHHADYMSNPIKAKVMVESWHPLATRAGSVPLFDNLC
jgi:hypothetical protein